MRVNRRLTPLTLILSFLLFSLALLILPASTASARPPANQGEPSVALTLVADGLVHPLLLVESPDGTGRRFIGDQAGQIWILNPDGTRLPEPFLDLAPVMVPLNPGYDERGLLGLAFHPDYAENGRFFVYYSAPLRDEAPDDFNHTTHISEFTVSATDPNQADAGSERLLLAVDEPQLNHNGGDIAFGPTDGYLYIALGDGGGRDDVGVGHVEDWYTDNPGGNAQDIEQNLLGSILRIDVDSGDPYSVPADNPFVGVIDLDEQWAYGFRNPYRMSFDMGGNNALYVGDAGQEMFEEVSIVTAGGNYGWNVREGAHCFSVATPEEPPATCPTTVGAGHPLEGDPLIDPVLEFLNAKQEGGLGLTMVGGYVYRGAAIPEFEGNYIFGTWSRGNVPERRGEQLGGAIFIADTAQQGLWNFSTLQIANDPDGQLDEYVLGFGQDAAGEVYVLTTAESGPTGSTGNVYRLDAPTATAVTLDTVQAAGGRSLPVAALLLLAGASVAGVLWSRRRVARAR